jgi:hypothetical protein
MFSSATTDGGATTSREASINNETENEEIERPIGWE